MLFTTEEVQTKALNEVTLQVERGEFVAIMGPSGCGKSTLLNILGTLDSPTSGSYLFEGKQVDKMTESQLTTLRKGNLGFIFQSFNLIVTDCKLLLADEPTGNLDSVNGVEVMDLLSKLNQAGTTIIIVTHSERDATYAHRVIHLLDGKIVAENINRPMTEKSESKYQVL